ncbi:brassinosteroid-responsive RING-H2 [Actinidia rufa]|uniref:Brassinosteroid-responsive RING-H2 n=1 Tax=Actinidia rufa TaxID=165716 RepID=A0A7J0F1G6_9ERIC|nr:brassinosteroid-responsive RING-H2 [Actinidia rufa]
MGFPVGYTEVFLPKLFIHILSLLGLIRALILALFRFLGISDFLEPEISYPENPTRSEKPYRVGGPDPGVPAGGEVRGSGLRRRWRRELRGVPIRVRGRGGDPVVDQLQAYFPPELCGPLDGPRSEHVSAL